MSHIFLKFVSLPFTLTCLSPLPLSPSGSTSAYGSAILFIYFRSEILKNVVQIRWSHWKMDQSMKQQGSRSLPKIHALFLSKETTFANFFRKPFSPVFTEEGNMQITRPYISFHCVIFSHSLYISFKFLSIYLFISIAQGKVFRVCVRKCG